MRSIFLPTVLLFLLLSFILIVDAKTSKGTFKLTSEITEAYLGKFSFSSHIDGSIDGDFIFEGPNASYYLTQFRHRLMIAIYDDKSHEKFKQMMKKGSLCDERLRVAQSTYPLSPTSVSHILSFHHKVHQSADVLNLHAYITDCPLEFVSVDSKRAPIVNFSLKFMNGDNHLPQDEIHMPSMLLLLFLIVMVTTAMFLYLVVNVKKTHHQVHLVQIIAMSAFFLTILSIGAQLLHLTVYSSDGLGLKLRHTFFALDFLSELGQLFSELMVAFIFISISSFGWLFSTTSSKMGYLLQKRYIPLFGAYVLLNVYFQYQNRKYEEDFNYFAYDLSHFAGCMLVALRLLTMLVFLIGVSLNHNVSIVYTALLKIPGVAQILLKSGLVSNSKINQYLPQNKAVDDLSATGLLASGDKLTSPSVEQRAVNQSIYSTEDSEIRRAITHLTLLAFIWFISYPLASLLSVLFLNPSMRRLFTVTLSLSIHIATMTFFMFAFAYQNSSYYKSSSLINMGTVFGATQTSGKVCID